MSKILDVHDILEVATKHPDIKDGPELQMVVLSVQVLANRIASAYGIVCGEVTYEGKDFSGLAGGFYPTAKDQPCPDAIAGGDPGGDWEMMGVDPHSWI